MVRHEHDWRKFVTLRQEQGLLAKELYLIHTKPTGGADAILAILNEHLAYQMEIEAKGIMFAAGPLADESGERWSGEGIIIIRASSLDEAKKIANADPMHKSGARSYVVRPWLMNEGALKLTLRYSSKTLELS